MNATHFCSSCRRGENKVPADGYYVGKQLTDSGRTVPFKGWLCDDHVELMLTDGAELRRQRSA